MGGSVIYTCTIKDDPNKTERLATKLWADIYDVLCHGKWCQYKESELDDFRQAKRRISDYDDFRQNN
jgi:hypothetical protein